MTTFESLESLRNSIEAQKQLIQSTDISIKKITGRDPVEERRNAVENSNQFNSKKATVIQPAIIYSRLNSTSLKDVDYKGRTPDQSDDMQVSLASSVVRVGDKRSRNDAMKELKAPDRERGRRMFSILQSTLNQFKAESAAATVLPQTKRRYQVDAKVEAKATKEREKLKKERIDLFRKRKEQQLELTLMTQKMRMIHGFEAWKEEVLKMVGFIRTETTPHIFYRPRSDNKESESRKDVTKAKILEMIDRKRRKLETDYQEIISNRRRRLGLTIKSEDRDANLNDHLNSENHEQTLSETAHGPGFDRDIDDDFAILGDDDHEGGDWVRSQTVQSQVVPAQSAALALQDSTERSHRKVHIVSVTANKKKACSVSDGSEEHFDVDEPVLMDGEQHEQAPKQPVAQDAAGTCDEPLLKSPCLAGEDRRLVRLPEVTASN